MGLRRLCGFLAAVDGGDLDGVDMMKRWQVIAAALLTGAVLGLAAGGAHAAQPCHIRAPKGSINAYITQGNTPECRRILAAVKEAQRNGETIAIVADGDIDLIIEQ